MIFVLTLLILFKYSCELYLDVNEFSLNGLSNGNYPVYFNASFILNHTLNISIVFQTEDTKNLKNKNYQSVETLFNNKRLNEYTANASLVLNENLIYEATIYIYKLEEILYKIYLNRSNGYKYNAIDYSSELTNDSLKRNKRFFFSKPKLSLKVEACIYLQYELYESFKEYLLNTTTNYVDTWLAIYFTNIINAVNIIYKRINDPDISIEVELVKLVSIKENVDDLVFGNPKFVDRLDQVNSYFNNFYAFNNSECDHIYYLYKYNINYQNALGQAFGSHVCNPAKFTSMIIFKTGSLERTMAHELLHNIGVDSHDNEPPIDEKCIFHLMNSFDPYRDTGFKVSKCSLNLIKKNLLDKSQNLKPQFRCLVETNNFKNEKFTYEYIYKTQSNGNFLSLNDQCKFHSQNNKSFYCFLNDEPCKSSMCFDAQNKSCSINFTPLAGTYCGPNRQCHFRECIEINNTTNIVELNEIESKSKLLREMCPQGTNNHELYDNYCANTSVSSYYDMYNNGTCKNFILADRNYLEEGTKKCKNYEKAVYCEYCIKRNLNNCHTYNLSVGVCPVTTCENLSSNPCFNGGTCVTLPYDLKIKIVGVSFECKCPVGYSGDLCLTFNPCDFKPCPYSTECLTYGDLGRYYCVKHTEELFFSTHSKSEINSQKRSYLIYLILSLIVVLFSNLVLLAVRK